VAAQAAGEQREEVLAAYEAALVVVVAVFRDMPVEPIPGKALDELLEHGSLVAHDIGPAAVDNVGERRFRI
jgi:hypothetical protein